MNPIYLDFNATTPIDAEVAQAMRPYLEEYFGNPSSAHSYGAKTKMAVENARQQVAALLGCSASEIIFTSGGTESNNYAIKGVALANRNKGKHIITSQIEHPAVIEVCKFLERQGFNVTFLPVDEYGKVNINQLEKSITTSTILISIMHANNEVGTIQPLYDISEIAKDYNIIFHSDAAQSVGKIETNVRELGVDLLSIAGHKLYAPKGIGALYIKSGTVLEKFMHGANHEQNLRAGTENVLEIVGLGKACEIALQDLQKNQEHLHNLRDRLLNRIIDNADLASTSFKINGHPLDKLPNTLSISFKNIEANTLLSEIQDKVAASAGAACHSDKIDVSAVLTAMKVPIEFAMGTIRFSTGKFNTIGEIDQAAKVVGDALKRFSPNQQIAQVELTDISNIKLTRFTHGLGCACKIRPQYLEKILKDFPKVTNPNVLVGLETSDDAAVYQINDDTAIVQTVDFFTPVVDNPYDFGSIAAANSLSDIYAMGAKPLFALNIVAFPENRLPAEVLKQILKGASDKCAEAGIQILGGHTIEDNEPKFGLVVTGSVHPKKILKNTGAKVGDVLILTKPLGTGILATALKHELLDEKTHSKLVNQMSMLNAKAADVAANFEINACTDVTGFGLLGHLKEMIVGSGVGCEIYFKDVPILPEAIDMATAGVFPGGTVNNQQFVDDVAIWNNLPDIAKLLLCDAQTSGGLLFSIAEKFQASFINELLKSGVETAACIGKITNENTGKISVKKE